MMRILLGGESLRPPLTGIGNYTRSLLLGLREDSRIDELKCFRGGCFIDPAELESGQGEHPAQSNTIALQKSRLRQLARRVPGAYRLRNVLQRIRDSRFKSQFLVDSIYHEPNYILQPFAGRSITTIHDLSHIHYPEYHPRERVRYMERELPATITRATHIITDSQFVRREVIALLGVESSRVSAIPLGVEQYFYPRNAQQTQSILKMYGLSHGSYLLAVATLEPRKNLEGLIKNYLRLPAVVRKRFPLIVVGGSGWHCQNLEKMLAQLAQCNQGRHLGYVERSHLPILYSGAGAFAFPSYYEGFGLPPLEAMASGVPVLTSASSSMAEVAGTAAVLVAPEDDDSIFAGLERLLLDDQLRSTNTNKGLLQAQGFTWQDCVRKTVDLYCQISL